MKKPITLLLGLCAGCAIGAMAQTVAISSVTPQNLSVLRAKQDHIKTVDLKFEGAKSVVYNPEIMPVIQLITASGAPNASVSPSYLVASETVEAIEGGVRITYVATANNGGEEGITYTAGTNYFALTVPEGMVTVTGADGVERKNELTYYRWMFDNMDKVNPVGITDGKAVYPDDIQEIEFPASLLSNSIQSRDKYQIWAFPNGLGKSRERIGNYEIVSDDNGVMHGKYVGYIAELPEGEYYLVPSAQQMFKNVAGDLQIAPWLTPITLKQHPMTDITLDVAEGSSLQGKELPRFGVGVQSKLAISVGYNVVANIANKDYNLVSYGNSLGFSAADSRELLEKYTNGSSFRIKVTAPKGSIRITKPDGIVYVNNEAEATFTARIINTLAIDDFAGKSLYAKCIDVTDSNGKALEMGGDALTVSVEGSEIKIAGLYGNAANVLTATITDSENRKIEVAPVEVTINGKKYMMKGAGGNAIAGTVDTAGKIILDGWKLEGDTEYTNGHAEIMVADGTVPTFQDFTAQIQLDANNVYHIYGVAQMPETQISHIEVYANGQLVCTDRHVNVGQMANFVIDANPVRGSHYEFTAKLYNCDKASALSEVSIVDYNPLMPDEIEGTYTFTWFEGVSREYKTNEMQSGVAVMADHAGNFNYTGTTMSLFIDGEVNDGKCVIFLQDIYPGFEPAGVLDLLTGEITFYKEDAYFITVKALDPDTNTYKDYEVALKLVEGAKNDGMTSLPLKGKMDIYGMITIDPWSLIQTVELYNDVYAYGEGITAIRKNDLLPKAPDLSVIVDEDHVKGTVTVATEYINGQKINPDSKGHSIEVYRNSELVFQADQCMTGAELEFTDEYLETEVTYSAYGSHLGNKNPEPTVVNLHSSAIDAFINTNGRGNVYDLRGVEILHNADAADIRTLSPGVYIINGRKIWLQ